jgi:hydroxyethylthiazole kinase-like uncharacterized protein yjeF
MSTEILTVAEMYEADRRAVAHGVPSLTLMENAGTLAAHDIEHFFARAPVVVLCGPGNNGGDGFVVARVLKKRGWDVRVMLAGMRSMLKGDAAEMAKRWGGEPEPLTAAGIMGGEIIIDALFGAGLSRPLEGEVANVVRCIVEAGLPVIALDIPSGISGDTGKPLGDVFMRADRTITFFRKKPGHLLMPGRDYCGDVHVGDIGIPHEALIGLGNLSENTPDLWRAAFPKPGSNTHKYSRGASLILSGPAHATGAARLAARGALRVGAGLVAVASPDDAVAVNAASLTAIMVRPFSNVFGFEQLLADPRIKSCVVGPGAGIGQTTRSLTIAALGRRCGLVLDADALTSFSDDQEVLFTRLHENCVLTPHEGEFAKLFPDLLHETPSRLAAAREAAEVAGCTVILKGPDTVIAAPDGRAAVNANAPPTLATAGSGDVLAGFVAGLLAQGMPTFEAACAAVWLHGEAANHFGPGLIAEDLPEILPRVLKGLAQ